MRQNSKVQDFKCKKDCTLKSLRDVECFLNSFSKVLKGKKIYDCLKK